ncbi:MAG: hypothetical protein WAT84_01225 [Candidatus Moraniibacteriota bacterium]
MSKFLTTLFVTLLSLVASCAHAEDTDNYALLSKKGMPEITVSYRLASPEADRNAVEFAFKDIQAAFVKDGWVIVGNDWTKVPESTNEIRRQTDRTGRCFVDVIGMPETVHIQAKCGPGNLYGNGVFVQAEINPVTSRNWRNDVIKVPNILHKIYVHYVKLDTIGLARFVPTW